MIFAPHAIDNNRFNTESDLTLREELNINKNNFVFLFAGKLEQKKNPVLLLNAFIELNIQNTTLILVGNGELEVEIKNIISKTEQSIRERIFIIDFQNQQRMPLVYKSADVFVLPSQGPGETWGLAINEAMASGVPVIVSDKCGCHSDLIEDYKNGIIFKSNDLDALKQTMKYMAEDKERLNTMGQKALAFISNWTYEKVCTAIESTL